MRLAQSPSSTIDSRSSPPNFAPFRVFRGHSLPKLHKISGLEAGEARFEVRKKIFFGPRRVSKPGKSFFWHLEPCRSSKKEFFRTLNCVEVPKKIFFGLRSVSKPGKKLFLDLEPGIPPSLALLFCRVGVLVLEGRGCSMASRAASMCRRQPLAGLIKVGDVNSDAFSRLANH